MCEDENEVITKESEMSISSGDVDDTAEWTKLKRTESIRDGQKGKDDYRCLGETKGKKVGE